MSTNSAIPTGATLDVPTTSQPALSLPTTALADFTAMFRGREDAYGTDAGHCIRRAPDWMGAPFGLVDHRRLPAL